MPRPGGRDPGHQAHDRRAALAGLPVGDGKENRRPGVRCRGLLDVAAGNAEISLPGVAATSGPGFGAAYRRDISHSCRSAASAACCSESIVPALLSAPNTGLRQPHEQTARTAPSPSCWMVVECSTAIGSPTGKRPGCCLSASRRRAPRGGSHQPGQLASIPRSRPDDDVAEPGHACRLPDARHLPERRGHHGRRGRPGPVSECARRSRDTTRLALSGYSTAIPQPGHPCRRSRPARTWPGSALAERRPATP